MKAIIFDFDGVIHDTFEFHRKKIKEFTGIDLSVQDFKKIHKKNFFLAVPKKFNQINWKKYPDFVHDGVAKFVINKKIKKTIIELNKNYSLFIVSSGGENNISNYLSNNKIKYIFKEILGMETFKKKTDKFNFIFDKYNLATSECLFVTDTLGDIIEANEVDLKTIAVDFGFHCRKTLEEGNPYKIISSFEEILNIVK